MAHSLDLDALRKAAMAGTIQWQRHSLEHFEPDFRTRKKR